MRLTLYYEDDGFETTLHLDTDNIDTCRVDWGDIRDEITSLLRYAKEKHIEEGLRDILDDFGFSHYASDHAYSIANDITDYWEDHKLIKVCNENGLATTNWVHAEEACKDVTLDVAEQRINLMVKLGKSWEEIKKMPCGMSKDEAVSNFLRNTRFNFEQAGDWYYITQTEYVENKDV